MINNETKATAIKKPAFAGFFNHHYYQQTFLLTRLF